MRHVSPEYVAIYRWGDVEVLGMLLKYANIVRKGNHENGRFSHDIASMHNLREQLDAILIDYSNASDSVLKQTSH